MIGDDPENPDVFIDNEQGLKPIRRSINDAIQEVAVLNGGFVKTFHVPLTAGKSFYKIQLNNANVGWVKNCWLVNIKRRLPQTDLHVLRKFDYRWYQSTGTPNSYYPIGVDVLGFYPKPAETSDIVQIEAVVIPAPYTNDKQKTRIRKEFEWSVINYAVSEYWISRGEVQSARQHMQTYIDDLGIRGEYVISGERVHQLRTENTLIDAAPNVQEASLP